MHTSTRPTNAAEVVEADRAGAVEAAVMAVAMRAPYSYTKLARAHRNGTLVELLGKLDSYTLRAQAVRYAVEAPVAVSADYVHGLFCRLLTEAR